ncbi:hypothetical protein BDR26DRAFT_876838, partial [Obelidium mucronatum]
MKSDSLQPSTPAISFQGCIFLATLCGAIAETSANGILSVIFQWSSMGRKVRVWITGWIMTIYNLLQICAMVLFVFGWFIDNDNCQFGFYANLISHTQSLFFDAFIMYKTLVVSGYNTRVRHIIFILATHRLIWAIGDLALSKGFWDVEIETCGYRQDPVTGTGYTISDILIDVFSTVASWIYTWNDLNSSFSALEMAILQENCVRSALVTAVNVCNIYVSNMTLDPFSYNVFFLFQQYIYTRILNSEFFWMDQRRKLLQNRVDVKESACRHRNPTLNKPLFNTKQKN